MRKKKTDLTDEEYDLRAKQLKKRRLLIRAGVSGPYASQIVSGERRPGYKLAFQIYEKTGLEYGDALKHARRIVAEKKAKKSNSHSSDNE